MPDDVPMDPRGPVSGSADAAGHRYTALWNLYLAVIAVAVAAAVLVADEFSLSARLVSVAALAGLVVLHAAAGHRAIVREQERPGLLAAELALFAVAVVAVPVANWALFAVMPLIFQLVKLRHAVIAVIVTTLVMPVSDLVLRPAAFGPDLVIALISGAAGLFFGFWIVRVVEQSTERRRLIVELESSRAEVARLSREAERARLAAEIHDTLAQGFTSIITLLQAADPGLQDEKIALAVRTARENLAEARELVAALSPSALASGSLPAAVRRQADRFQEESGVKATVRVTGDERSLPTAVEVVLLRAAQEALTNVRRHANANEAAVLLAYAPASVRLVVRDDGCGFVPGAADGYGLAGMRSRAEQVKGVVTVRSDPDLGTTVEVEVPA
ncbi:sensor histidine kinase [Actinoplanes sp. URMC 104]|uniref:sensor histidine kinase n=1 Tax=Actinoplanes sp. URMC 104 TaxID=3423409 RepID=UPI003F1CD3EC